MNERQYREFSSVSRAHDFLRRQKDLSPELASCRRTLGDVVERVTELNTRTHLLDFTQTGKTVSQQADALRAKHMIPISRRGKLLFRGEPRLVRALKVPHKNGATDVLLAAARAMLAAITPHKKLFVAAGARPSFLTDFRAALALLAANAKAAEKSNAATPAVRRALARELARGRAEVSVAAGYMPAWIAEHGRSSRAPLAVQWRTSHRITARLGRPSARRVQRRTRAASNWNDSVSD
jgi:hypothetical protein